MLVRLRTRLDAIERSALDDARPLPGPDPRPAPWQAWITNLSAVDRFGTQSARAAALLAPGNDVERLERAVTIARSSPRRVLLGQALLHSGACDVTSGSGGRRAPCSVRHSPSPSA